MNASKRVDFIKNWIIDYVQSMPKEASTLVVGVSGGIDSAVVSTISSMTGLKTFVLSMPIKQIKNQDDLSKLHCNWLVSNFKNVSYLNVDLDNVFSSFESALGKNNSEHAFAKSQVWEMGEFLKIDQKIISAPPTDGLWVDGRNDEDQLGMTYKELEEAMENPKSKNYDKYLKIRENNLHKMKEIPVCKFD